jgi:hypothetical protein
MSNGISSTSSGRSAKAAASVPSPALRSAASNGLSPLGAQSEIIDYDDKIEWVKNNTNVSDAAEAVYAVTTFTDSEFHAIRDAQRNGERGTQAAKDGETLEDYIKNAPQWDNSRDLHRGMSLSTTQVQSILKGIKNGEPFDINYGGTASWSGLYTVSEKFARDGIDKTPVIFRTKKMSNASPVMHLSTFYSEMEVLSSKDNNFRPIKATKKKINGVDGYVIDVIQI